MTATIHELATSVRQRIEAKYAEAAQAFNEGAQLEVEVARLRDLGHRLEAEADAIASRLEDLS